MNLQVAGFLEHSTVNGMGFRSVVFVSGCHHACPDCQNQGMQDFSYGETYSVQEIFHRIMKNKPLLDGVTFSGGEPFEQCEALSKLAKLIKKEGLNIWCYSGYTYEALHNDMSKHCLLECIDVLVDGPFIKDNMQSELKYRGSINQHIYTLQEGKIVNCLDETFSI